MNRNIQPIAEDLQLFDGGRAIDIGRHQIGPAALALEHRGQFTRGRRLAGSLQTGHHDDDRLTAIEADLFRTAAKQCNQFLMDYLDDLLAWREAFG